MITNGETFLKDVFATALEAARAESRLIARMPPPPAGRTMVVGAGKASAAMARTFENAWPRKVEGLVVVPDGYGLETQNIEIREAAHPLPDARSKHAARDVLALAEGLGKDDLLVCLISGGGSALLSLPAGDITPAEKRGIHDALLKSGAGIGEINTVRKHLSAIKGGRLARAAHPARIAALLVSDVPGDDPATIASGPVSGDPTSRHDARKILEKYQIPVPESVRAVLNDAGYETPVPDDPVFENTSANIVADSQDALSAAADHARRHGITPVILGNAIEGESRDVARVHAGIARQAARFQQPASPPCLLLSGGETSVTVRGGGTGGRNLEFMLALYETLPKNIAVEAIACDTDGIDGNTSAAGAIIGPDTSRKAAALEKSPGAYLEDNDAYTFFQAIDGLITTGPTYTNVNDFRAILISTQRGMT